MDLLVVDTNIFINVIFGNGFFKYDEQVLDLEEQQKIRFAFSRHTLNELYKILSRKINENDIFNCYEFFEVLDKIVKRSRILDKPMKLESISNDKGDQYFIELAVAVNANFLITNDTENGLLEIGIYESVNILTPQQYIKLYNKIARKAK